MWLRYTPVHTYGMLPEFVYYSIGSRVLGLLLPFAPRILYLNMSKYQVVYVVCHVI